MSVATATTRLEQRARVAPGSLMSGLRLRTNRRQQFEDDDNDPLALLDQDEDLPLDSTDQERIITELRSRARQGARIYRSACLVLVSLIIALYLLPLSSYLVGTHSAEDHLTRFHGLQGARSSLPWYLLLALVQAGLLGLMGWELAHLIPLPRLCPTRAVYGTAPVAVARHLARASASCGLALAPRVQYAGALAGAAAVPPILSLVKGNDGGGGGALWWALGTFAAGVAAWSEMSIASEERELTGLSAARYTYTTL